MGPLKETRDWFDCICFPFVSLLLKVYLITFMKQIALRQFMRK